MSKLAFPFLLVFLLLPALSIAGLDKDLLTAVEKNNLKNAQALLKKGANPNARVDAGLGRTPFHYACSYGNLEMVKLLLSYKADVNLKDNDGWASYRFALNGTNGAVLALLLKSGVNKDDFIAFIKKDEYEGFNQYHIAVRDCRMDLLKICHQYAPELINSCTKAGFTPLMLAVKNTYALDNKHIPLYMDIIRFLLTNNADTSAVTTDGMSAMDYAVEAGSKDLVKLLAAGGLKAVTVIRCYESADATLFPMVFPRLDDVNGKDADGMTLICHAILKKDKALVADLLKKGSDIKTADRFRRPVIQFAAQAGDIDIMEMLLKAGADINSKGGGGDMESPLNVSISKFNNKLAEYLVGKGALVNTPGRFTPLQTAIVSSNYAMMVYLVQKGGADVNLVGENFTPLHTAVRHHLNPPGTRLEFVEFLCKNGADVNKKVEGFGTPLEWAVQQKCSKEIEILKRYGAKQTDDSGAQSSASVSSAGNAGSPDALFHAIDSRDLQALQDAIGALSDINADLGNGRTALFYLVRSGLLDAAKFAISKGAKTDVVDFEKTSLLHVAADADKLEMVKYLLSLGLDVNARDKFGRTPLMLGVRSMAVAQALVGGGAGLKDADSQGWNALFFAVNLHSDMGCVRFLLEKGLDPNAKDNRGVSIMALAKRIGDKQLIGLLKKYGAADDGGDKGGGNDDKGDERDRIRKMK